MMLGLPQPRKDPETNWSSSDPSGAALARRVEHLAGQRPQPRPAMRLRVPYEALTAREEPISHDTKAPPSLRKPHRAPPPPPRGTAGDLSRLVPRSSIDNTWMWIFAAPREPRSIDSDTPQGQRLKVKIYIYIHLKNSIGYIHHYYMMAHILLRKSMERKKLANGPIPSSLDSTRK